MDMRLLVGGNVKRLRLLAGLTQEDLAVKSGFDQRYISDLERGVGNPTLMSMYDVAVALNTTVAVLVAPVDTARD